MQNTLIAILSCLTLLLAHACGIDRGRADKQAEIDRLKKQVYTLELVMAVIECESGWNSQAIGDGGRAVGLGQWHQATWNELAREAGMPHLKRSVPAHQIILTKWAFEQGYHDRWRNCMKKVLPKIGGA